MAMSAQAVMFPVEREVSVGMVSVGSSSTDGVVYVRELDESDDEVVRIVAESDDPVAAVGQCLRVGARALRAAHVSVDVDVIERSFSELESRFEARVTGAVDEIARTIGRPARRRGRRAHRHARRRSRPSSTQLLGDTFDADSKSSVLKASRSSCSAR